MPAVVPYRAAVVSRADCPGTPISSLVRFFGIYIKRRITSEKRGG